MELSCLACLTESLLSLNERGYRGEKWSDGGTMEHLVVSTLGSCDLDLGWLRLV